MPRKKPANAEPVNQITYDEFAARHQNELAEALDLLGLSAASLSGKTTLLTRRPPLPMAMQQLKETSFFRLLAAAGRENCPDVLRRLRAKPEKIIVDVQAASPSSWKTPCMAVRIVS